MRMLTLALAATALAAVPVHAQDAPPGPAQVTALPVRKVVLYKHGVGYFEREGPVTGDVTVPLSFKTTQMPDVLKSLYAVHPTGRGRIASVVYDSKDPIEKQLADIMVRVPDGNALTAFLTQLKGAPVEVTIGTTTVRGHVVGLEPIQTRTEAGVTLRVRLVLLTTDGTLKPIELFDATDIKVLDPALQRDLARMLEIYARARHADRKVVDIRSEGAGPRTMRVGYIVEQPIWKTTYRLILDANEKPLLQGFAIVENRTDEDWTDVELSFVAGSPLSFVMDLYTSYYPRRPVVGIQAAASEQGLVDAEEAEEMEKSEHSLRRAAPSRKSRGRAESADAGFDAPGAAAAPPPAPPTLGALLAESLAPAAAGAAAGELFSYTAKGKVSIKRGQAALVPILLEPLEAAERLLYYRADLSAAPQHAVFARNSTALTLEKGPVTVFEGATCQGESLLTEVLKPQMRAVLPYALETAVEVQGTANIADQPVLRATLVRGVLTLYRKQLWETRYTLKEKGGRARVMLVDHPKQGGFTLTEPAKPEEERPAHYRLRVEVGANAEKAFVVREERTIQQAVSVANTNLDELRAYIQAPYLSAGARKAVEAVAALLGERQKIDAEQASGRQERQRLQQDHERARQTLSTLRNDAGEKAMREKYLKRLEDADQRIDQIAARDQELAAARQALDQRLVAALEAFTE